MAIIRKQNEIDVYADVDEKFVTICEKEGHFDSHGGGYEDAFINIDVDHIDTIITALQKCKAEILAGNEVGDG